MQRATICMQRATICNVQHPVASSGDRCTADGAHEASNDRACDATVDSGISGASGACGLARAVLLHRCMSSVAVSSVACCMLHGIRCLLHVVCCVLHVACRPLPGACRLLPVACCVLPVACCMELHVTRGAVAPLHAVRCTSTSHARQVRACVARPRPPSRPRSLGAL